MIRVVVTGGRDYTDEAKVFSILDGIHEAKGIAHLAHGAASGADRMAGKWAESRKVPVKPYPADWHRHNKGAGPIRNRTMLLNFNPDLVVAFPGGNGTADCCERAEAIGITVTKVSA